MRRTFQGATIQRNALVVPRARKARNCANGGPNARARAARCVAEGKSVVWTPKATPSKIYLYSKIEFQNPCHSGKSELSKLVGSYV